MEIVFASYGDFSNNSFNHIDGFAERLAQRGHDVVVIAEGRRPDAAKSYACLSYQDWSEGRVERGVQKILESRRTLVHAWTPRARVQAFVRKLGLRYIVHLEDDEMLITASLMGTTASSLLKDQKDYGDSLPPTVTNPRHFAKFISEAGAVSIINRNLLSTIVPRDDVFVLEPGVDAECFGRMMEAEERDARRRAIGVEPSTFVVLYNGNVHPLIERDIFSLFAGIRSARVTDDVKLVMTGGARDVRSRSIAFLRRDGVIDLGWLRRDEMILTLGLADAFIQPGWRTPFNLTRFPSKIPEYLVAGRPVIMPEFSLDGRMIAGVNAILLRSGGAREIADAVRLLGRLPDRGRSIGSRGRRFAEEHLTWSDKVVRLEGFYAWLCGQGPRPADASFLPSLDFEPSSERSQRSGHAP